VSWVTVEVRPTRRRVLWTRRWSERATLYCRAYGDGFRKGSGGGSFARSQAAATAATRRWDAEVRGRRLVPFMLHGDGGEVRLLAGAMRHHVQCDWSPAVGAFTLSLPSPPPPLASPATRHPLKKHARWCGVAQWRREGRRSGAATATACDDRLLAARGADRRSRGESMR
jgi:hypothetical protein